MDFDADGIGNLCDGDADDDGIPNAQDVNCSDGLDNDGDGLIDFVAGNGTLPDPGCNYPGDPKEGGGGCGLGPELAGVLLCIGALRLRRQRGA